MWLYHSFTQFLLFFSGLKILLVPLIAGLLEVDVTKCTDFDTYFQIVSDIVNRRVMTLFDACHGSIIKLFIKPTDE